MADYGPSGNTPLSTHSGLIRGVEVSYIATAPCGCTYAARVGAPDKTMLEDAEAGALIDRVTTAEARERLTFNCPHNPKWGGLP